MHYVHHDHKSELPLILFTLCVSASVGVVVVDLMLSACEAIVGGGFAPASATYSLRGNLSAGCFMLQTGPAHLALGLLALALTTVGMLASVAHLAKPLRAPRALTNLASSWLSREILVVAAFWGCIAFWIIAQFVSALAAFCLALACLAVGCFLLIAAAKAYAIPSQPAWHGSDTAIELFAIACGAGVPLACALALWCQACTPNPLAAEACVNGCCTFLATKALYVPCVLGPVSAHMLFARAEHTRLTRLAAIEHPTPREEAALSRVNELAGPQRLILNLTDTSLAAAAVAAIAWAVAGFASPVLTGIPAVFGCIAGFLARTRFYRMAVTNRHAVRRNFR